MIMLLLGYKLISTKIIPVLEWFNYNQNPNNEKDY